MDPSVLGPGVAALLVCSPPVMHTRLANLTLSFLSSVVTFTLKAQGCRVLGGLVVFV